MGPRCRRHRGDRERRENPRYLPGIALPDSLRATTDLAAALRDADLVLVVVPSHAFAETLRALAPHRPADAGVAWATKGFEPGSGRFLHEVAGESARRRRAAGRGHRPLVRQGSRAGPADRADRAFATMPAFAQQVADALHGPAFRAYTGDDMLGAELGGAMKNVLAVATGVADGMQLGLNARAGMITRGLNEMLRLNAAIGGQAETLMGLAGLGDLVLTCTGDLSRNRRLGPRAGPRPVARRRGARDRPGGRIDADRRRSHAPGRTARHRTADLQRSARVLHGEITPAEGLRLLMAREQKAEYPQRPVRLNVVAPAGDTKKARPKPGFFVAACKRDQKLARTPTR